MNYVDQLSSGDRALAAKIADFVPAEVYDIHVHPYRRRDYAPGTWAFLSAHAELGCAAHTGAMRRIIGDKKVHGLYFGLPHATADRPAINEWIAAEVHAHGTPLSRALMLVSPADNPSEVAAALRRGRFSGLKVYYCYSGQPEPAQARVEDYAPEWMWEILHEVRGVLMLHIVRDRAIADPENQQSLRRLCRAYPRARLVLAHVARSFAYRHAREGLRTIADLDNAVVDTSAIGEAETFRAALEILGPQRVLWGSDFPVSELRGRCVTTGDRFFWLHPEFMLPEPRAEAERDSSLVGVESLLTLREACEDGGLTAGDLEDIFRRNALRILAPSLPAEAVPAAVDGMALWQRARQSISGGTGLLSKRAEQFDAKTWPAYFSRCAGCEVWDLNGRRHLDFAGGIGAVLLGYADPDVTLAVRRRLAAGSYCSLVNPQEVELAELLIDLHPWAGKVRFSRGGGEAMAMSVRIARAATGRSGVLFCGYHGWHDWYLAANLGESNALDGHLLPGLQPLGVPRELRGTSAPFRYNDLASLDAALAKMGDNLAAIVMEPMRSQLPQEGFLAKVAARCRAAGAVFIVDEVTSGLRYGFPGACTKLGVKPDLAVYAKAMSNGFPFGVVVGRDEIMQAADPSFISSSYWTDGVGAAAALAVLKKVRRLDVQTTVWQRGEKLQAGLREVAARHPRCRINVGSMPVTPSFGFNLEDDTSLAQPLFVRKMLERGFLVSTFCYLMLAHDEEKIALFLTACDEVMTEVSRIIADGRLAEEAGLPRTRRGFTRLA